MCNGTLLLVLFYFILFFGGNETFIYLYLIFIAFFITIWSLYMPLPIAVTTLSSISMSPFSFLLRPSTPQLPKVQFHDGT